MTDDEILALSSEIQCRRGGDVVDFARAIEEQARREEREACARVCEDDCSPNSDRLAAAIRARTTNGGNDE